MLEDLLAKKFPRAISALARQECPVSALTADWFACLFTRAVPPETAVRIWDCLLCEGPKVLLRTSLSLFKVLHISLPRYLVFSSLECGQAVSWVNDMNGMRCAYEYLWWFLEL